jgi:Zn-dependent peptidase ImmA (M78 family)/DNA-binding XRE family transcriptional regulator
MFNPARLALARKRRHLTKKELATRAGVSHVTLTRIERGTTPDPEPETVSALAAALNFPVEFFSLDDPEEIQAGAVSFRSLAAMTARQRDAALASGSIGIALDAFVNARFNLPAVQLLDLRDESSKAAADALRNHWALGSKPIVHMTKLLEAKGVRIFTLSESNQNVDAFSFWRDGTPYMFLNTFKSAERSRFDSAHELGHLVLHRHGAPAGRDAEREADEFASAFLMPVEDLIAHLSPNLTLPKLLKAKERWGVSVAALARNVFGAGLISDWHYREMCKTMSVMGYRRSEPFPRPREESVLWKKVLQSLWSDRIDKESIARALCIPSSELEALLGGLYGEPSVQAPLGPQRVYQTV